MSSAWSQLEQMLTCAICLDKFKNPRLLPCQHSFCGDACMEGLVDYARRQIKCPECRAEHRIPFQGVASLPSNVTLIRFLELHARITGEEPEPVPTFMEKCSVCGEKVEGVQRCAHCEKKVCPECKEAHVDLLRREINRINGQSRRCFGKMQDFRESLTRCEERLQTNFVQVKREIEESCRRLIEDLQAKRKKLLDEVEVFNEQEVKTINKLKLAIEDELDTLESNSRLADDKLIVPKYPWTDQELSEAKEIYAKAMEFVRLFDPEVGDFTRKMRFTLIPEFEPMRRRICELGELKFTESACLLMANSLSYCSATGTVAAELCQAAASQAAAAASSLANQSAGYGLSHSNSNANLGAGLMGAGSTMLELPSMQNALVRSQSDHRLASQFQQRLKQQQQQQQMQEAAGGAASGRNAYADRYGASRGRGATSGTDYETESLRSRYAPRGSTSGKDYDLLRDWPRPGDSDPVDASSFGSSIQFKSAFMRRKEKERQQYGASSTAGSYYAQDDDDDLTSEASYGGMSGTGRNVRFYDSGADLADRQMGGRQLQGPQVKLFDCKDCHRAPLSGVPKLESSAHLHERLHQMGAKAIVDKKLAEEEGKRDKDLVESARQAMNRVKSSAEAQRQANKQRDQQQDQLKQEATAITAGQQDNSDNSHSAEDSMISSTTTTSRRRALNSRHGGDSMSGSGADLRSDSPAQRHSPTPSAELNSSTSTVVEVPVHEQRLSGSGGSAQQASETPSSPASSHPGGRRGLYGAAVTERSKRQLSNAIQDAVNYTTRRRSLASAGNSDSLEQVQTPPTPTAEPSSSGSTASGRPKRTLRSTGRSMSKGASVDRQLSIDGSTGSGSGSSIARRRRLRGDVSQQSVENLDANQSQPMETHSKNYSAGSGGHSVGLDGSRTSVGELDAGKLAAGRQLATGGRSSATGSGPSAARLGHLYSRTSTANTSSTADQTSTTTDEDDDDDDEDEDDRDNIRRNDDNIATGRRSATSTPTTSSSRRPFSAAGSDRRVKLQSDSDESSDNNDHAKANDEDDGDSEDDSQTGSRRNAGNRRSRELLPNAVNKLLDRSAQIRRDSQEQRSRGDSPQRQTGRSTSGYQPTPSSSQSSYYSAGSSSRSTGATGAGSSSGGGGGGGGGIASSVRSRLAYQRSQSIHDDDSIGSGSPRQRTSTEDDYGPRARISAANSSDRTPAYEPSSSLYRRDQSAGTTRATTTQDSGSSDGFQSRFLARSRTAAALSAAGSASSGSHRSQASLDGEPATAASRASDAEASSSSSTPRSYLSSRDRFMQSTAGISSSSGRTSGSAGGAASAGNFLRQQRQSAAAAAAAKSRPRPPSATPTTGHTSGYSTESTRGFKTHSEYLRNKFSRRTSSNSSASSSALSKSRSSHSAFMPNDSNEEDDEENNADQLNNAHDKDHDFGIKSDRSVESEEDSVIASGGRNKSLDSRKDSAVGGSLDRCVYSDKGRMLFKLGTRGADPGNFTWPRGVAVGFGSSGREIVVADSSNHRVQIFDSNGKFLNEFGSYGSNSGEFDCLAGVAINKRNKNYIVSDRYNHRVQIFDSSGKFLRSFGEMGRETGKFNLPWGVAVDSGGQIYVCDKENHRIQMFDSDGEFLSSFGACGSQPGQMQHPHYIAAGLGKVVVTDTNNHRVQVFDSTGRLIKTIGREGSSSGQFKFPRGVAMDEDGYIIVGDSGNNRLQIFNTEGQFVKSIGTWGSAEGEFKGIEGVAVDTSNNILVCDRENHRIQVF